MDDVIIEIYLVDNFNYGLIFNPDHISLLRHSNTRVCGHLIGSLANNSYQINEFGSPLLLTYEEIKLLDCLKFFKIKCFNKYEFIHDDDNDGEKIIESIREEYKNYLEDYYKKQNLSYREKRASELSSLKEKIISGKRKSILDKINTLELKQDNNEMKDFKEKMSELKNELEKLNDDNFMNQINDLNRNDINTEIFLLTPNFLKKQYNIIDFRQYLTTTSNLDYKFIIYKYIWSLGYYLTSNANKFGGDYLIYNGDPCQYHSKFILLCLNEAEFKEIKLRELIHYGRIATNVKKLYLIACVFQTKNANLCNLIKFENENILFTCIKWSHI
jgi:tRNA-intron lyase